MAFLGNIDKKDAAKFLKEFREISATFCFFPNTKALLRKEGEDSGNCSSNTCVELQKNVATREPGAATFRFDPAENERSAVELFFDDLGAFDDLVRNPARAHHRYPYRNPWAFVRDASICHEGRVKELIAIARRAFAWRVVQTNPKLDIDNIRKLTYAGQAKSRKLSWGELLI